MIHSGSIRASTTLRTVLSIAAVFIHPLGTNFPAQSFPPWSVWRWFFSLLLRPLPSVPRTAYCDCHLSQAASPQAIKLVSLERVKDESGSSTSGTSAASADSSSGAASDSGATSGLYHFSFLPEALKAAQLAQHPQLLTLPLIVLLLV